jgi:hypothetical protein
MKREGSHEFPAFCSGFCYWLSRRAMKVIANADKPDMEAEDRWCSKTLLKAGIEPKHDDRYVLTSGRWAGTNKTPRIGNHLIAAAEYPGNMITPHNLWLESVDKVNRYKSKIRFL